MGGGDVRVVVTVVNMPVLGWWLLLLLVGCRRGWWGGGGCVVDAGGGVVVDWVVVMVVVSLTQMVGSWSWWVTSWSRSLHL